MSREVARFECETCGDKFLSALALRGHQSTHRDDEPAPRVIGGETP